MSDFNALLKKSAAEDKPPKVLPQGTWRLGVKGGAKYKERKGGGSKDGPMADALIPLQVIQPLEDVHPADLEAFGDFTQATVFHKITIWTEDDFYKVNRFYITAGFAKEDVLSRSRAGLLELKGGEVVAFAKHRQNPDDPERPFVDLENVVSATS